MMKLRNRYTIDTSLEENSDKISNGFYIASEVITKSKSAMGHKIMEKKFSYPKCARSLVHPEAWRLK